MLRATSESMAMICRITGHQREQKKTPSSATDIFIPNSGGYIYSQQALIIKSPLKPRQKHETTSYKF